MAGKKKIIILYSTAGMGHKKAALAIYKVFSSYKEEVDVKVIDVLDYATRLYKYLYLNFYVFLMSRGKWLWGKMYYISNNMYVDRLTRKTREKLDYKGVSIADFLLKEDPDAIIATHFLLPSIAGILKVRRGLKSRLYTVITDYGPHAYWLSRHISRFFVGSESVLKETVLMGVPPDKINVTGIPTTEEFRKDFDLDEVRETHGIMKGKKTVFIMSGGFGVGPIEKMLVLLNSSEADKQVIVVCGHNKKAYDDIKALRARLKYPVILFGFTDKVAELMAVSDLMITKAGGISVTEAMNSRLPMVLFGSVPGQETWNEIFLTGKKAAVKAEKIEDIPRFVDEVLLLEDRRKVMKDSIEKIRRPFAAEKIVEIVMNDISK